jgi:glutathione S-transferase
MQKLEIISSKSCPFAQRSRMVLLEKGIDFDFTEIDLDNKPDWFLKVSPYSKVPVIRHNGAVIWESAVINEYLDEVFPEPPLLPHDPVARASAQRRHWRTSINCVRHGISGRSPDLPVRPWSARSSKSDGGSWPSRDTAGST